MPLFSAFTPLGCLEFSGKPSQGELLYRAIRSNLGEDGHSYAISAGTRQDAWAYTVAMGAARAKLKLRDAANQSDSRRVTWFLAEREEEYGLAPGPKDDVPTRQAAVTAARQLAGGSTAGSLFAGLSALLGAKLLAVRATKPSERVVFPANLGDQPQALKLPTALPRVFKLLGPVTVVGSPFAVAYSTISTGRADFRALPNLLAGDTVIVGAEHPSLAERVTITSVGNLGEDRAFTATFTRSHDKGALVTTQPYAFATTNQRQLLVTVTAAAAADPETRRKVNDFMRKAVRSTTIWAIVSGAGGTSGPFTLDSSLLDATPFAAITY